MAIYEIAKLRVRIEAVTEQTEHRLQPYLTDGEDFDFDASTTMAEIEEYMAKSDIPTLPYLAEDAIVLTKISRTVLDRYDGCFFHSSSLEIDGTIEASPAVYDGMMVIGTTEKNKNNIYGIRIE